MDAFALGNKEKNYNECIRIRKRGKNPTINAFALGNEEKKNYNGCISIRKKGQKPSMNAFALGNEEKDLQ